MKVKQVVKKAISVLLSVSMLVGMVPMTVFGAVNMSAVNTSENVATILNLADSLRESNARPITDSDNNTLDYSDGKFTWDTESKTRTWAYYNGIMFDTFLLLNSKGETNEEYVRNVFDDLIVYDSEKQTYSVDTYENSGNQTSQYIAGELDSVPMGRVLFDLLENVDSKFIDLSTAEVPANYGTAIYNASSQKLEIYDTTDDVASNSEKTSQVYLSLPQNVLPGETVQVTIKGTWNGTTGFRVWIGSGQNSYAENVHEFNASNLATGDFEETFSLTGSTNYGESTKLTIKGLNDSNKNIDGLKVESIKVEYSQREVEGEGITVKDFSSGVAEIHEDTFKFIAKTDASGYGIEINNPFTDMELTDGATISFWLTPQVTNGENPWQVDHIPVISFINTNTGNTSTVGATTYLCPQVMKFDVSGDRQFKDHGAGSNMVYTNGDNSTLMSNGTEYFVTFVINDDALEYYVNGVKESTTVLAYNKDTEGNKKATNVLEFLKNADTKMYIGGLQVDETVNGLLVYDYENIIKDYVHNLEAGTIVRDVRVYDGDQNAEMLYQMQSSEESSTHTIGAEGYEAIVHYIYNELCQQPSYGQCGGNYIHKTDVNSSWYKSWNIGLDGIYMAQPFLMEYANALDHTITNKNASADTIYGQVYNRMMWIAGSESDSGMYDVATGLYHHGWNATNQEGNGHFWARGIGWYAAALVDIIELMPTEGNCTSTGKSFSQMRADLIEKLEKLFDGLLKWQDANTGMWTNVINREQNLTASCTYKENGTEVMVTNHNELETSGSALFAYSLMKAFNNGYVDAAYGRAGLKAYNGIVENNVTGSTVKNIIISASVYTSDEEYLSKAYKEGEAKGVAPLIMAATEVDIAYEKLGTVVNDTYPEEIGGTDTLDVVASGSAATSMTVTEGTDDVASAVDKILADGYKAYKINLSDDQVSAATIRIPIPYGVSERDLVVYKIENGTRTEVEGTVEGGFFYFKTIDNEATYVLGTKYAAWDKLQWITIGELFEKTSTMVPGEKYVIQGVANASRYLWWLKKDGYYWSFYPDHGLYNLKVTETTNNKYYITPVSEHNLWQIDDEGRLFSTDNGTPLYLFNNSNNEGGSYTSGDKTRYHNVTTDISKALKLEVSSNELTFTNDENTYIGYSFIDPNNNEKPYTLKIDGTGVWVQPNYNYTNQYLYNIYQRVSNIQVALDGTTKYSIAAGSNLTEDTIKQNAVVYYRENENDTPIEIPLSEDATNTDLECVWADNEYDPSTAGIYTMTVTYKNVEVGTITVDVTGYEWTDITSDTYYPVQEMIEGNEYIISLNDSKYFGRWYLDNGVPKVTGITESASLTFTTVKKSDGTTYENGAVTISPADQYNTWYMDENNHIYMKYYTEDTNYTIYYLTVESNSLAFTQTAEAAVKWQVTSTEGENVCNIGVIGQNAVLKVGSKGFTLGKSSSSQISLNVWSKNPNTQVALAGQTVYNINPGDETITEEYIKKHAYIYGISDTGSNPNPISWNDAYVDYSWDKEIDTDLPNTTYTMTVKYCDQEIGKITVTVGELQWKNVVNAWERVQSMEVGKKYVIARTDTSINTESATTVSILGCVPSDGNSYYSSDFTTDIQKNADGTYLLSDIDTYDVWYIGTDNYIYGLNGADPYYLASGNAGGNEKVQVVYEDYKASNRPYNVVAVEDSDTVQLYAIVTNTTTDEETGESTTTETYNYLGYTTNNDGNFIIGNDPFNDDTKLTLYSEYIRDLALEGTLTYNIYEGDNSLTEELIKSNAEIIERITSGDNATTNVIDWDWYDSNTVTLQENPNIVTTWYKIVAGERVKTTFDAHITGTYIMEVTYDGVVVGEVTVNVSEHDVISKELVGNTVAINTSEDRAPNFENIKYIITYSDGSFEELTVADGLTITGTGYTPEKAGNYEPGIYYNGMLLGTVKVNVSADPYYGLEPASTPYPQYPNKGAVGLKKKALNEDFTFRNTGVAKVELDVAGVSDTKGVDVVLVVDVSNSMAWTDSWSAGMDADEQASKKDMDKIPYVVKEGDTFQYDSNGNKIPQVDAIDKLDSAMTAASTFADELLSGNIPDNATDANILNNTLSFVTFAGHDKENIHDAEMNTNMDSVMTVFTNVRSVEEATNSFNNTKFTKLALNLEDDGKTPSGGVGYWLQIAGTDGQPISGGSSSEILADTSQKNRGNTNYDYAFGQAAEAVKDLKANYEAVYEETYEESGRQTVVIFMTDGAPSHYNGQRATGGSADRLYETTVQYEKIISDKNKEGFNQPTVSAWTEFIRKPNTYAQELRSMVDEMYAVGFDLDHGGFTGFSWSDAELQPVLENLAGVGANGTSNVKKVYMADTGNELTDIYIDLAKQFKTSGREAYVIDVIGEDFTLQRGTSFTYVEEVDDKSYETVLSSETGLAVEPKIEVISYDMWTKKEVLELETYDETLIGTRQLEKDGGKDKVLETVTFSEDGLHAYSNEKEPNEDIMKITYDAQGNESTVTIDGVYFTYTKDANGKEQFDWKIGTIDENQVSLSYYVYLKGAKYLSTSPADGVYPTNEYATLTYIDMEDNVATPSFEIPKRSWGTAITVPIYYLVNKEGHPINAVGDLVPFEYAYEVHYGNPQMIRWGNTVTITGKQQCPPEYTLFDDVAAYTVYANAAEGDTSTDTTGDKGYLNITHGKQALTAEAQAAFKDGYTTQRTDGATDNVGYTEVYFAVTVGENGVPITWNLNEDKIVIDYGKSIQVDVLEDNTKIMDNGYIATLKGFREYDSDPKFINYVQTYEGTTSLSGTYGSFQIAEVPVSADSNETKKVVQYNPNKILSGNEKVFTVIELLQDPNFDWGESDYKAGRYILYQPLTVIPATNVYYETDFADSDGVFTFTQKEGAVAWSKKTDADEIALGNTDVTSVQPTENPSDNVQDGGRIGQENHTYGFDSTYDDDTLLSDGSSYYVEGQGKLENSNDFYTTTKFSFAGTGFDIFSRTGKMHGTIRVEIYKVGDMLPVKTISVINKADSEWGELYQVPVISAEGLDYGNYNVVISVYEEKIYTGVLEALSRGNQFYFDAIRIYNPMGAGSATDETACDAYLADGQAYPYIREVRDILLTTFEGNPNEVVLPTTPQAGVLFIELFGDGEGKDTNLEDEQDTHYYKLSDYKNIGPNNEVYLSPGQAIAFKLNNIDLDTVASIDVAVKSTDGDAVDMQATISKTSNATDASTYNTIAINGDGTIQTSSAQYYDLLKGVSAITDVFTPNGDGTGYAYVLIQNPLQVSNGNETSDANASKILSVTDIKIGYKTAMEETTEVSYQYDASVLEFANTVEVVEANYDIKSAAFHDVTGALWNDSTLVLTTTQDVETLKITNDMGLPVYADISYVDGMNGARTWNVDIKMLMFGEQVFTITGYGRKGSSGELAKANLAVEYKKGGLLSDGKNLWKTSYLY